MARQESEREDLLREATALALRVELRLAGSEGSVVVGFRRGGAASVFFGADPVYQFTTAGELRRAYIGGLLYKAHRGRLVELRRERSEREVALVSRELPPPEMAEILNSTAAQLRDLKSALCDPATMIVGRVPPDADVLGQVRQWLDSLPPQLTVAISVNVR